MTDYQNRIAKLQAILREKRVCGAILAGTDQMLYLTGWREGGHERFVGLFVPAEGEAAFVVPAMNSEQAKKTPAGIEKVFGWGDAEGWRGALNQAVFGWESHSNQKLILVDDELLSVHLLNLQAWLSRFAFEAIGETMRTLREVKSDEELASMQRAADLIDGIYANSLTFLKVGITETQLADHILAQIKAAGSTPSFPPLICFGANAASPHHHTGNTTLNSGDIAIIDIGCTADGYASDITRTVCFGEPSDPEAKAVYEIVYRAHHAARGIAKPGVTGEAVDAAAREVISKAGFGEFFLHRLGHGIGLSCHEPPSMVQGNLDQIKPGMCFSVEPGIYLNGRFGVRLENIVTVTGEGVRSFNAEVSPTLPIIGG